MISEREVHMAVVLAVSNQKGGVGKTTTAIILAQELKRRGQRVLMIDTDPQCNSTDFYGAETDGAATMMDIMCSMDTKAEECIQHREYGDIIPCERGLKDAENLVRVDDYRSLHLKRAAKGIADLYDYVVIDTPPSEGVMLRNVLAYSNYVTIPVQESGWALKGLMDYYGDTIQQAQDVTNPALKIAGILVVMSKPATNESRRIRSMAASLAEKMGTTVFSSVIRASVKVPEALTDYGVPLYQYAPQCTSQQDYEAFVDELLAKVKG